MDNKKENLLPTLHSQLLSMDEELWNMIEERAQEILWTIEPNLLSEENRKDVIHYVRKLIGDYYGAHVLPFGSVPLKTYLPDGDIDLTALSPADAEDDLALTVCSILEREDDPEYQIKDIQHIPAQVDQLVGKNHLFKRSIVLIKAWCYYESRILGAHHGLLSTYAIEILVLYIVNRFHSSLRGPLEVLYMFLDYYGSFDWDNNYASIWGPKALSSLPEIVETPECDQGGFLFQKDLLRNYRDMCSFSIRASENVTPEFPVKLMNILDPLRNDNNVGRCVNLANLHRIRLALSYGARKLKQVLALPGENMGSALEKFFFCTLERNGKGERADVDIPVCPFGTGRSEGSVLDGDYGSYYFDLQCVQLYPNYSIPVTTVLSSSPSSPSHSDMFAISTQQNWSEGDFLTLQQNWNMFYQSGRNVYIPRQTLYHPTYSLDEGVKSRGTGTYIPDLNYNSYWDIRTNANQPREISFTENNELPKFPTEQLEEEVHSETNLNADSTPFEITKEYFPFLPGIPKATLPTHAQGPAPLAKASSETDKGGDSMLSELSSEDLSPLLPCVRNDTPPTQAQDSTPLENAHSEADMGSKSQSFELTDEDFPLLPKVCSETHKDGKSTSFELSKKDFPLLQSSQKTVLSESAKLTKQAKSFTSSKLNNMEFGTLKYSQSLKGQSLSTKSKKEDCGVSLSQKTVMVVPNVASQRKQESYQSNKKMD
ncbi:hypothetical protein PHAVU_009G141900 [Phaseolus vulgaris]|uniref:PAP/OAS1 substrate-binding-related domain-containing protein n=1 Tax=Phaseolus vulgaris TaxID=3885 RepID=V7AVJ1_PHAVU|nr:hypothetical protein PHAVU_009G141900g [Phaseolus vulgaris]ESW09614.1 hypothetical protein PHAVU_009G141900g [Phaseolus vulgaris]